MRAIAESEVAVLQWLLQHAAVGDVAAYRTEALERLTARPCCDQCAGLLFRDVPVSGGYEMLADALAVYPDGEVAGVLLWAAGGEVAWLELHDTFTIGTAKRFPGIADLMTWEQRGSFEAKG